jgi:hypothetical protein
MAQHRSGAMQGCTLPNVRGFRADDNKSRSSASRRLLAHGTMSA